MHERIKWVSDMDVFIEQPDPKSPYPDRMHLRIPTNESRLVIGFGWGKSSLSTDTETRAALREVLEGHERDGNFASLRPQPKYRAYANAVEAAVLVGKIITSNRYGLERIVESAGKGYVNIDCCDTTFSYEALLEHWLVAGEPCGVLVEE